MSQTFFYVDSYHGIPQTFLKLRQMPFSRVYIFFLIKLKLKNKSKVNDLITYKNTLIVVLSETVSELFGCGCKY